MALAGLPAGSERTLRGGVWLSGRFRGQAAEDAMIQWWSDDVEAAQTSLPSVRAVGKAPQFVRAGLLHFFLPHLQLHQRGRTVKRAVDGDLAMPGADVFVRAARTVVEQGLVVVLGVVGAFPKRHAAGQQVRQFHRRILVAVKRSEERRVGKECRCRW